MSIDAIQFLIKGCPLNLYIRQVNSSAQAQFSLIGSTLMIYLCKLVILPGGSVPVFHEKVQESREDAAPEAWSCVTFNYCVWGIL